MTTVELNDANEVMRKSGRPHVFSAQIVSRILDKVVVEYCPTKKEAEERALAMMALYMVDIAYVNGPYGYARKMRAPMP